MSKEIELTLGKVAIVDDEWYEALSMYNWYSTNPKNKNKPIYASRRVRIHGSRIGRIVTMHNHILPAIPGVYVDHINGNGLDNRSENLRYCTMSQNNCNTTCDKENRKSKYKGVSPYKKTKKWRANIFINNKQTFLGSFDTEEEAAAAYNEAAIAHRGEFARINIIDEQEFGHTVKSEKISPSNLDLAGIQIHQATNTKKWQVHKRNKRNNIFIGEFDTYDEAVNYGNISCEATSERSGKG